MRAVLQQPWLSPCWRRAVALLSGLWAAKAAIVVLRVLDGGGRTLASVWSPVALTYQDALLAAAWLGVDCTVSFAVRKRARAERVAGVALWVLVAAIVAYAAFNVAVARVFSTPLTWSMLEATGGALSDSIFSYVTLGNLVAVGLVAAVPLAVARAKIGFPPAARTQAVLGALLAGMALLGPVAAAHVETLGLHRNALLTLARTSLSRLPVRVDDTTAAGILAPEGAALDLGHLAAAARGRNVIWVILESTGAEYLGIYGGAPDPTPNLTRLAQNALVFDAAYSAYPESIKGLYSMLCSTYPAPQTAAADYAAARLPCRSIAARLRDAAYATGFFHSGRFRYLGMQHIVAERSFEELHDAGSIGGKHASSFGTDDASTVARLLAFVDGLPRERRFFAVYSPIAGHHPYRSPGTGPRPFPVRTELDAYLNDLYAGDAALGQLIDGMRTRGLEQSTLWLVFGDHGEAFGQHEGNFAHTLFLYEENMRVPLVVAAPGLTVGRVRVPQIASLVDLRPTTLALLGLPSDERDQGRSLLLADPGVARFQTDHGPLKLGLRQAKWKLIHETEHDRTRLFDLERDPGERTDIAARHAARVERYRRHLLEWSEAQRALVLGGR